MIVVLECVEALFELKPGSELSDGMYMVEKLRSNMQNVWLCSFVPMSVERKKNNKWGLNYCAFARRFSHSSFGGRRVRRRAFWIALKNVPNTDHKEAELCFHQLFASMMMDGGGDEDVENHGRRGGKAYVGS